MDQISLRWTEARSLDGPETEQGRLSMHGCMHGWFAVRHFHGLNIHTPTSIMHSSCYMLAYFTLLHWRHISSPQWVYYILASRKKTTLCGLLCSEEQTEANDVCWRHPAMNSAIRAECLMLLSLPANRLWAGGLFPEKASVIRHLSQHSIPYRAKNTPCPLSFCRTSMHSLWFELTWALILTGSLITDVLVVALDLKLRPQLKLKRCRIWMEACFLFILPSLVLNTRPCSHLYIISSFI